MTAASEHDVVLTLPSGLLRGTSHTHSGTRMLRFAGIPYAAPPVGALRFRAPQPVSNWTAVLDAASFGPASVQSPSPLDTLLGGQAEAQSEDCLRLNVWTPATDSAKRPVLVWIHGGAFVQGSGATPVYDGSRLAARGDVVVVTVNYRLGELGWLALDELGEDFRGSGNNGLRDQIMALRWVAANASSFGGDPSNVTVFGESAGAMSVASLLAAPAAKGLFRRAILQSGAANAYLTADQAAETTRDYCSRLGVTVAALLDVPAEQLLAAQGSIAAEAFADLDASLCTGRGAGLRLAPVQDGVVLPTAPLDAIAAGSAAGIDILIGTNTEEWNLFMAFDQRPPEDARLVELLGHLSLTGNGADVLALYRQTFPKLVDRSLKVKMLTDCVFTAPAHRLAASASGAGSNVWQYVFSWPSPAMAGIFGACHALELPFVFGTTDLPGMTLFLGPEPPISLSHAMMDAWISFARTGDPNHAGLPAWPPFDPVELSTIDFSPVLSVSQRSGADVLDAWK